MMRGALARFSVGAGVAAVSLGVIWWPEYAHYRLEARTPSALDADGIAPPTDAAVRRLLWDGDFGLLEARPRDQLLAEAAALLASGPGAAFSPSRMESGGSGLQLRYAGLYLPDLLLHAYEATGDVRYLQEARRSILSFIAWEATLHQPVGYVWNDHAVANRSLVLIRFWLLSRDHPLAADDRATLLAGVLRTGAWLSKPTHFTVRTNHGVMQNSALLYLALAFPSLPEAASWRRTAIERLELQMKFYLSASGTVLEHSAGYHLFGDHLMHTTLAVMAALREPIPPEWARRTEAAARLTALLVQPGARLPQYGNSTPRDVDHVATNLPLPADKAVASPQNWLDPVAGLAVSWRAEGAPVSQAVLHWGNFASRAHKHADEPSLQFWQGRPWWTAVGYWPYDDARLDSAIGWRGSNAPHLRDEPGKSPRSTIALAANDGPGPYFMDLQRRGPGSFASRRQVMQCGAHWLVVDDSSPSGAGVVDTLWTLPADVSMTVPTGPGIPWRARSAEPEMTLSSAFALPEGGSVRRVVASDTPFAGWVASDGTQPEVMPATTLEVTAPAGSTTAMAWRVDAGPAVNAPEWQLKLARKEAMDDWEAQVVGSAGSPRVTFRRKGMEVSCAGEIDSRATLAALPDPTAERDRIDAAYQGAKREYPAFRFLAHWRERVTELAGVAFVVQEAFFFAAARRRGGRRWWSLVSGWPARLAVSAAWAAATAWLMLVYFAA